MKDSRYFQATGAAVAAGRGNKQKISERHIQTIKEHLASGDDRVWEDFILLCNTTPSFVIKHLVTDEQLMTILLAAAQEEDVFKLLEILPETVRWQVCDKKIREHFKALEQQSFINDLARLYDMAPPSSLIEDMSKVLLQRFFINSLNAKLKVPQVQETTNLVISLSDMFRLLQTISNNIKGLSGLTEQVIDTLLLKLVEGKQTPSISLSELMHFNITRQDNTVVLPEEVRQQLLAEYSASPIEIKMDSAAEQSLSLSNLAMQYGLFAARGPVSSLSGQYDSNNVPYNITLTA